MDSLIIMFSCLIIFEWMPDIMNYILSCADYYFISLSILELCSGVQLSYMEIIWSFCVLLLWFFVKEVLSSGQSSADYALLLNENLSEYSTQYPMIYEFFLLVWWEQVLFPFFVWAPALFLSTLLNSFFLLALGS